MTTERIDVLAVFDAELGIGTGASLEEIKLARAAVAELIEADKALDDLRNMPVQREPVADLQARLAAAWARRRAALARVGGAS